MKKNTLKILVIFSLIFSGCQTGNIKVESPDGYKFASPDAVIILPSVLHEISGLTHFDPASFACVQDEAGIVFILDLASNQIRRELPFASKGILRALQKLTPAYSSFAVMGLFMRFPVLNRMKLPLISTNTGIPSENNEGLCYDARKQQAANRL